VGRPPPRLPELEFSSGQPHAGRRAPNAGSTRAGIHLQGPIGFASNELIAKARGEINRAIAAAPVSDNNLRSRRSLAQMLKK